MYVTRMGYEQAIIGFLVPVDLSLTNKTRQQRLLTPYNHLYVRLYLLQLLSESIALKAMSVSIKLSMALGSWSSRETK